MHLIQLWCALDIFRIYLHQNMSTHSHSFGCLIYYSCHRCQLMSWMDRLGLKVLVIWRSLRCSTSWISNWRITFTRPRQQKQKLLCWSSKCELNQRAESAHRYFSMLYCCRLAVVVFLWLCIIALWSHTEMPQTNILMPIVTLGASHTYQKHCVELLNLNSSHSILHDKWAVFYLLNNSAPAHFISIKESASFTCPMIGNKLLLKRSPDKNKGLSW